MTAGEIAASGRAALVTWLCEVEDRARARINEQPHPRALEFRFSSAARTHLTTDLDIWPELFELPSLQNWIQAATADQRIGGIFQLRADDPTDGIAALRNEARDLALDLVKIDSALDIEKVRSEVETHWQDLASGAEKFEIGADITFMRATENLPPITIGNGIELRLIAGEWASERFIHHEHAPAGSVALSCMVNLKRGLRRRITDFIDDALDRGLLGLRLARPRWTMFGNHYYRKVSGRPRAMRSSSFDEFDLPSSSRSSSFHELTAEDVERLRRVGPAVASATRMIQFPVPQQGSSSKELAFRAFSGSFSRSSPEDRILDCAIVLEALFSDSAQEMTHKVATRAALLLTADETRAKIVMKTARALYNLRSKVIHARPGEVVDAAGEVIGAWRGEGPQSSARDRWLSEAGLIGQELTAQVLSACVLLEAAGSHPFSQEFPGQLDLSPFDSHRREQMLRTAGIFPSGGTQA